MNCPECNGTGEIDTGIPAARGSADTKKEKCTYCEGAGTIPDDVTPLFLENQKTILRKLDEILNKLGGK